MQETLKECPYCGVQVGRKKYDKHLLEKCPNRPGYVLPESSKTSKSKPKLHSPKFMNEGALNIPNKASARRVLVRVRLDRLYSDLSQRGALADDQGLADAFMQFYAKKAHLNEKPKFDKSELSVSIKTVSGGLPSLGKKSK